MNILAKIVNIKKALEEIQDKLPEFNSIYLEHDLHFGLNGCIDAGGRIVVGAELIEKIGHSKELITVFLGHELGHFKYKHCSKFSSQLKNLYYGFRTKSNCKTIHNTELTADRYASKVVDLLKVDRLEASKLFSEILPCNGWPYPKKETRTKIILDETLTF